jgi:Domain of unknown function (DUF4388)
MARGTVTHRLVDVLQVLQMARKTGILLVNRDGAYKNIEEGSITLQNGQIVDASLDPYRGQQALQQLQTWQTCYFVFQAPTQANHLTQQSPTQMSPANRNSATNHSSGSQPLNNSNSGPLPIIGAGNAPQRIRDINEVLPYFDKLGLTRLHRQLFLLIDGQRTIPEILRLMGHRTDEVDTLLNDLGRAGLIRW